MSTYLQICSLLKMSYGLTTLSLFFKNKSLIIPHLYAKLLGFCLCSTQRALAYSNIGSNI